MMNYERGSPCGFFASFFSFAICDLRLGQSCDSVAVPRLPLNSAWDYVGDREKTPPYGYLWRE